MNKYVFTVPFRQFKPGDSVPETWDTGMVLSMLQVHKVRKVDAKSIDAPPADKSLRAGAVKRKGAA